MCVRTIAECAMTQASRTCSNCLVWFAALLSPTQALQGTPMFRAVVSELQSFRCACANQVTDANDVCECVRCQCGQCQCRDGEKRRDQMAVPLPGSPSECPRDCWCRRSAEPQSQPVRSIRFTLTVAQMAVSLHKADHGVDIGCYTVTHVLRPDSAQQVCVQLCRFLT